MGAVTGIEWTDHTFNPWRGCTKVAPECANCYADTLSKRNPSTLGVWGQNGTRVVAAESYWREPIKWNKAAEQAGERRRVFCASLADVFEDWQGELRDPQNKILHRCRAGHVTRLDSVFANGAECDHGCNRSAIPMDLDDVRRRLFALIDATPHLDWLLLTKRPENIRRMWNAIDDRPAGVNQKHRPNVWLGTSAGTQETADKAIPELLKCRDLAPVLFVSCEPMLGPVNFRIGQLDCRDCETDRTGGTYDRVPVPCPGHCGIDWVICGGESGHHARPLDPKWARSLRDQAAAGGVPFFFKQWGEWYPITTFADAVVSNITPPDRNYSIIESEGQEFARWGKKYNGSDLDGREWNELPLLQEVG